MNPHKDGPNGEKKFKSRSMSYTGVYKTPTGRWRAQIGHDGKVVQLGMYENESAAAHHWDIEAIRLRGNSANLNFPELKPAYVALARQPTAFFAHEHRVFSI